MNQKMKKMVRTMSLSFSLRPTQYCGQGGQAECVGREAARVACSTTDRSPRFHELFPLYHLLEDEPAPEAKPRNVIEQPVV